MGIILYSNEDGKPLLNEWGAKVGEKLPSGIGSIVQKVLFQNSPGKIEIKAGNSVYLVVFHPLIKQECVTVSGFDISYQKELEEKLQENERKLSEAQEMAYLGNSFSYRWILLFR